MLYWPKIRTNKSYDFYEQMYVLREITSEATVARWCWWRSKGPRESEKSLSFVRNRYERTQSAIQLMQGLGWEPLETRRLHARLCDKIREIHCRTDINMNSFFPRTMSDHNKQWTLPIIIAHIAFPQQILSPYTYHPLHGWCPNTPCHTPMRRLAGHCINVEVPRWVGKRSIIVEHLEKKKARRKC
jgi:hypothetical protein